MPFLYVIPKNIFIETTLPREGVVFATSSLLGLAPTMKQQMLALPAFETREAAVLFGINQKQPFASENAFETGIPLLRIELTDKEKNNANPLTRPWLCKINDRDIIRKMLSNSSTPFDRGLVPHVDADKPIFGLNVLLTNSQEGPVVNELLRWRYNEGLASVMTFADKQQASSRIVHRPMS